jgi:hypothetical protein
VEPVLEAQVEGGEPLPLPREGVAGRIRRHCELGRRPRLKEKMNHCWENKKVQIRISVADPGSGAFLTPEPGMGNIRIRILDEQPGSYF